MQIQTDTVIIGFHKAEENIGLKDLEKKPVLFHSELSVL